MEKKNMSEIDPYADPEVYFMDELETPCDYGLEYCMDPQSRDLEGCISCDYMCGAGEFAEPRNVANENPFNVSIHALFSSLPTCFECGCPLADEKTGTCEDECCIAHPKNFWKK